MASPTIDPLIVLRSANALGYGPEFRFGQYLCFRRLGQIVALGAGAGVTSIGAKFGPVRRYLQRRLPPGSGPTPEQMQRGWMTIDFVGREGDQEVQTQVRTEIDAGYAFTARMISSAALWLVRDRDQLPDRCGVMTPAVAMAEPLLTRLQAAGMHFEVR